MDFFLQISNLLRPKCLILFLKTSCAKRVSDVEAEGLKIYEKGGIQNDIDAGPAFLSIGYMVEKNYEYLVGTVDAYQLKAIVASEAFKNSTPSYPDKKKELGKLADGLKDTDNQELMLVRLKK